LSGACDMLIRRWPGKHLVGDQLMIRAAHVDRQFIELP
jgi:hypothetical protein